MLYAMANGERVKPSKGLKGACIACDGEMTPKCGHIITHHWAHRPDANCDPWQAGKEGEWHLKMKLLFESYGAQVEVRIVRDGVTHVADVVLADGTVVELQNSALSMDKIQAREEFYENMAWIWNGRRFTGMALCWPKNNVWRWIRPHKTVQSCTKPVYFDIHGDFDPLLVEYSGDLVHLGEWEGFDAWHQNRERTRQAQQAEFRKRLLTKAIEAYHSGDSWQLRLLFPEAWQKAERLWSLSGKKMNQWYELLDN